MHSEHPLCSSGIQPRSKQAANARNTTHYGETVSSFMFVVAAAAAAAAGLFISIVVALNAHRFEQQPLVELALVRREVAKHTEKEEL